MSITPPAARSAPSFAVVFRASGLTFYAETRNDSRLLKPAKLFYLASREFELQQQASRRHKTQRFADLIDLPIIEAAMTPKQHALDDGRSTRRGSHLLH